jgi:hypothetical protein
MAIYGHSQAKNFREAQQRYQQRRSEALREPGSKAERYGTVPAIPTPEEYLEQLPQEEN